MTIDIETQNGTFADTAKDFGKSASDAATAKADDLGSRAKDWKDQAASTAGDAADRLKSTASDLHGQTASVVDDLKNRAADHMGEARTMVSSIADEARSRIGDIVDQQKTLGADKLSGLSRAAQSAAGELDQQNPQVARLVRDAASSVDRFAGDLRSSDLSDIVQTVTNFARKQPIAFFAGSVLAGFVLARFLKSEPAPTQGTYDKPGARS